LARIIISHLASAAPAEARLLLDLARAFEARGHQPILWSASYIPEFAPYYLPLNWKLKRLPEFYADLRRGIAEAETQADRTKWVERVNQLIKQDWTGDRGPLVDSLFSMSGQVLDTLRPDLLLSWNTLCPHTGVACDLARARGIPCVLIEKAVFPDTWIIEEGGLLGHSVLAGVPLESLVPAERFDTYRDVGRRYLEQTDFAAYNRYGQTQESPEMARLVASPEGSRQPRVAFFPPDDGTLGFVPVDGDDRRKSLPGYLSSFEAAEATAQAHAGVTVFKPHPSFAERVFPESAVPGLHVIDYDFRKLIEWSEVAATTGSGLAFVAMAMDRPVLLLANDMLAGKGIAYEAREPASLPEALRAACDRADWEARVQRFHALCGYLISDHLVSSSEAAQGRRRPEDAVDTLCTRFLAGSATGPAREEFWAARATLLTPAWVTTLNEDTERALLVRQAVDSPPSGDAEDLLEGLRAGRWPVVVLDFDHTLYRENSTERFLDTARPKAAAFLLAAVADACVNAAGKRGVRGAAQWRDIARVVFVTLGLPWAWLWWRVTAARRMAAEVNAPLAEAVAAGGARRMVILSLGMEHVIRPLAEALPFPSELIACSAGPPPRNLRGAGKARALREALSEDELAQSVYVTDSAADLDVCGLAGSSYLIQWAPYPPKAFHDFYIPFRYVVKGKYPGLNYLRNQILKEEYLMLLLAYAFSPVNALVLALLYASLYCIYELGYWNNDHRAARSEAKPTVSPQAARFADYPIQRAWLWAALLGAAGLAVAHGVDAPIRDGSLGLHVLAWAAVLAGLHACFTLFNRLPVQRRLFVFPWLHAFKAFACAVIVPLTPLGILLLAAQVASQTGVYYAYRRLGSARGYNRQIFRALFFGFFALATLAVYPDSWRAVFSLQSGLIGAWLAWRMAERAFGRPLGKLTLDVLRNPRRVAAYLSRRGRAR
jgi:phosphoserine phosphatase